MSLRGRPLEQDVTLPDGRVVRVRVGVPDDSYIAKRELNLGEIVAGLESGDLKPTAGALEPLADRLR